MHFNLTAVQPGTAMAAREDESWLGKPRQLFSHLCASNILGEAEGRGQSPLQSIQVNGTCTSGLGRPIIQLFVIVYSQLVRAARAQPRQLRKLTGGRPR